MILIRAWLLVISVLSEERKIRSRFEESDVLRLTTNLRPVDCYGYVSVVARVPKGGRQKPATILRVYFNVEKASVMIYRYLNGRLRRVATSTNNKYLLTNNEENSIRLRPINCFGETCDVQFKLNGKVMTNSIIPGIAQLKLSRSYISKIYLAKAVVCEFIRAFSIMPDDKSQKYIEMNEPNCGRTFLLQEDQLSGVPSQIKRKIKMTSTKTLLNTCERKTRDLSATKGRVVGGIAATPGMQPWIAAILIHSRCSVENDAHKCGGTLIKNNWVLTAAHCLPEKRLSMYRVKLGDYYNRGYSTLCNTNDERNRANIFMLKENKKYSTVEHEIEAKVAQLVIHNDYKQQNGGDPNDIALMKLKDPVEYNQFIQPACLPTRKEQFETKCCYVAGWGKTKVSESPSEMPSHLQVASLPKRTASDCRKHYPLMNTDNTFCAGYDNGRKDTCQGDSGGPFVCKEMAETYMESNPDGLKYVDQERAVLVGITSYGKEDCDQTGIYVNVYQYMDWIHSNIYG